MDRWVIEQNIARFRERLRQNIDASRRREIERLLEQEQERLRELDRIRRLD